MRLATSLAFPLALLTAPALAQEQLSPADTEAAFEAAGFKRVGEEWRGCDDPGTASYTPGAIETVQDLNGDGRPEAIVTEGSLFCYGGDEVGFSLVSQQADGSWTLLLASEGIATMLPSKGTGGWPDIEVGGQGFCFPVQRWNGSEYELNRFEYEGAACTP